MSFILGCRNNSDMVRLSVFQKIIVASVIIVVAWLLLLSSNKVSTRVKKFVTGLVIASPIPPIP